MTMTHVRAVERIYQTLMADDNRHFRSTLGLQPGPCLGNLSGV